MSFIKLLMTFLTFFLLTSCSTTAKKNFGLIENMPDEYQVKKVQPLEVPPHFKHTNLAVVKPVAKPVKNLTKAEKELLKEFDK